jgi:hypothetical protein
MEFEQAVELAAAVEADPAFAVVAVGRFELLDNLVANPPDKFAWAVSVVYRLNVRYCAVVRSVDHWREFRALAPAPPLPSKPKPVASQPPAPKPKPAAEQPPAELSPVQLSLF